MQLTDLGRPLTRANFARPAMGSSSGFAAKAPAGWAPGHALAGPALGQDEFFLDRPFLSLLGNGAIAAGAGFVIPKTTGTWNTLAWAVAIVAGLRALNDFSKLRG